MVVVLSVIALFLVGVFFLRLWKKSSTKTLQLNNVIGLRTHNIMANETVWEETHRRYSFIFLTDGLLFLLAALLLVLQLPHFVSVGTFQHWFEYAFFTNLGVLLLVTIVGGLSANRFAKKINMESGAE